MQDFDVGRCCTVRFCYVAEVQPLIFHTYSFVKWHYSVSLARVNQLINKGIS
jgi:hypothetical protein